jgi:hypothetical protein
LCAPWAHYFAHSAEAGAAHAENAGSEHEGARHEAEAPCLSCDIAATLSAVVAPSASTAPLTFTEMRFEPSEEGRVEGGFVALRARAPPIAAA